MYNVLIVDDEPAVFEGLSLMLDWEQLGFRLPDSARSSDEALSLLDEIRYPLIITDIRMPGMNGLELIAEIRKASPDSKTLIISGYDEFNYAKKAMKLGVKGYLLKPVDRHELSDYLTALKAELDCECSRKTEERRGRIAARDRFFCDLVSGGLTEQEIADGSAAYDFDRHIGACCVALLEIRDFYRLLDEDIENARQVKRTVRRVVEETVVGRNLGQVYEDSDGLLGVLLCGGGENGGHEEILHDICRRLSRDEGISAQIGYGCTVSRLKSIRVSREKALSALERRLVANGESVVSYQRVDLEGKQPGEGGFACARLLRATEFNDPQAIGQQIQALLETLQGQQPSPESVRHIVYSLLFGLCAVIKRNGGNADSVFNYSDIQLMLERDPGPETLCRWADTACRDALACIQSLTCNKMTNIIDQIKIYLDENYSKPLSIKQISRLFYLNPAYLGQLFKNTVGETISDYINKKRIELVKQLVRSGDMLIHEALEKAGYNNQGYFYKKFRLYEGISFAEYNENIRRSRNLIRMDFGDFKGGCPVQNANCRL